MVHIGGTCISKWLLPVIIVDPEFTSSGSTWWTRLKDWCLSSDVFSGPPVESERADITQVSFRNCETAELHHSLICIKQLVWSPSAGQPVVWRDQRGGQTEQFTSCRSVFSVRYTKSLQPDGDGDTDLGSLSTSAHNKVKLWSDFRLFDFYYSISFYQLILMMRNAQSQCRLSAPSLLGTAS